ncbi:MAG: PEP-utilizing enzyme [Patescibacteria group bacterium]
MDIEKFKHADWTKIWAGSWSFLTCFHFGNDYTKEIHFGSHPVFSQSIIFVKEGKSNGWATQTDRDRLGNFLATEVKNNPDKALEVCSELKKEVDSIINFLDTNVAAQPSLEIYNDFWNHVLLYYTPHINVKYVVDYLEPELLQKLLPHLEEARLYAEPVFKRTEDFMISTAQAIGQKINLPYELVLCTTKSEMDEYFKGGIFPKRNVLEERNKGAVILFDETDSMVITGADVQKVEDIVTKQTATNVIKGMVAYKGKVTGRAVIILDPTKANHFVEGDILVTGMTRPEYLSIMEKAAAIVTDAGGILSHAAISARELKKPCVIGTQVATKVLKDGDLVEVDADSGIIRLLKA